MKLNDLTNSVMGIRTEEHQFEFHGVAQDGKGYIEDRRPNANADPYVVATLLTNTCCSALA